MKIINYIKIFSNLIMIDQVLFGLPFAYCGMLLASFYSPLTPSKILWITIAFFSARSAGMCFNRVIDADIDKKNPRTSKRLIPSGKISKVSTLAIAFIFCLLLIFSSYKLNMLCFYLSFPAVFLLITYSYFKRFSASSHYYLGLVEAAAPIGAYLGVSPHFKTEIFILGGAILFWIAGMDIIYSLQDMIFDKKEKLFSIAVKFGKKGSLFITSISYLISVLLLLIIVFINAEVFYSILSILLIFINFTIQIVIAVKKDIHYSIRNIFLLNKLISVILLLGFLIDLIF